MATQDILVPDIGEYSNVDVIEISIKVGDVIVEEDGLITLETDKAAMEIPAPFAGKVTKLHIKEGSKVSCGDLIATCETEATVAPEKTTVNTSKQAVDKPIETAPQLTKTTSPKAAADNSKIYAGPAIRRLANELNINLGQVTSTGDKGRITKDDLNNFIKNSMQGGATSGVAGLNLLADPVVDFAKFGEITHEKLSRINKISAASLHRNAVKIPHITLFDSADITDVEAFRKQQKPILAKRDIKITPVAFIVKAVAKALMSFPKLNSSLLPDNETLALKQYCHVGFAADTPQGLMVPVIKDADKKDISQIAMDIMELSNKARSGKLQAKDMQGGCFTISSLGILGTTAFTPIVNMPEVAILGVSKSSIQPVYIDNAFVPRLMLPLSLSLDHRVIDGAMGAKFLTTVIGYLADIKTMLL